jgi:hypothetical protein
MVAVESATSCSTQTQYILVCVAVDYARILYIYLNLHLYRVTCFISGLPALTHVCKQGRRRTINFILFSRRYVTLIYWGISYRPFHVCLPLMYNTLHLIALMQVCL